MSQSESIGKLASALAKAQSAMTAAQLDRENPYFHSRYATLASIWDAIRKPLTDNELAVSQITHADDGRLVVETLLMHASGEWLSAELAVKPVKDDPQGIGSAISYARRYGLSAMVGAVSDEDDDGNRASQTGQPAKPAQKPAQPRPQTPTEASHAAKPSQAAEDFDSIPSAQQERAGEKVQPTNITHCAGFASAVIAMIDKLEGAGIHTGYKNKAGYDFEAVRYWLGHEGYRVLATEQRDEALARLEARIIEKAQSKVPETEATA